jgi:hypothetical protein
LNTVTFALKSVKKKHLPLVRVNKVTDKIVSHLSGIEQGWSRSLERLAGFGATKPKE